MTKKQKNNKTLLDYFAKLRIDAKTIIFVKSKDSLKSWKEKYPNAVVVL